MTSISQPRSRDQRGAVVLADARSLILAVVAATSAFDPNFALRIGAIIAAACGLSAVASGSRLGRLDLFILMFAGVVILSTTWTVAEEATLNAAKNATAYSAIAISARLAIQRSRDFFLVGAGLVAGALYALMRLILSPDSAIRFNYDPNAARLSVDSLNANYLAYTFATAVVVIVALFLSRPTKGRLLVAIALVVTMYVGIILNGTRGALVGLALWIAWSLFARINVRKCYWLLCGAAAAAFAATSTGISDSWVRSQVVTSTRETGDLNGRLSVWPVARELFADQPLRGYGAAAFPKMPENPSGIAAHNSILDVAVGTGLIGVALFVAVLLGAIAIKPSMSKSELWVRGTFVALIAPILLTGYWVESPVLWLSIALVSRFESSRPIGDSTPVRAARSDSASPPA